MWWPNSCTKMYGAHTLSAATVLCKPQIPPPPGVALELRPFGCRIAVPENQQIEFDGRIAALVDLEQRPGVCRPPGSIDELVGRIDRDAPDVAKRIFLITLLEDEASGLVDE